jgi:hypothetical protein
MDRSWVIVGGQDEAERESETRIDHLTSVLSFHHERLGDP